VTGTTAQISLRWLVQQGGVVAIPKASRREHLTRNLDIFEFSLTGEKMRHIDGRTGPVRVCHRNTLRRLVRRIPV
jgi:2,5-diketo-D-gluconate reductase B